MQMEDEKRDPRAKFVELANARVARAVKDLRLIGNLSNRRNYDYTEEEAKLILRTLETEINVLKTKFRAQQQIDDKKLFKL